MLKMAENAFRDFLFESHKTTLSSLIIGRRDLPKWTEPTFPPIHFLLRRKAEAKINEILDHLVHLQLIAKELRLERGNDSTTRIDLLGNSENSGLSIIELKKSQQTERQSFTELLAYANHFCSIFPGLKESALTTILVAPMETRTVRDAYVQELVANKKNVVALIPSDEGGSVALHVYYPDESYYQWFESNLLDDRSMMVVALSFPIIKGWIDTGPAGGGGQIPAHSKTALNTISSSIALRLQANGFHGMAYAAQKWAEVAPAFPYPNTIFTVVLNPFASFRTDIYEDQVFGASQEGRLGDIQTIHDQLTEDGRTSWIDTTGSSMHDRLIRLVRDEFDFCVTNSDHYRVDREISLPDWGSLKTNPVDAVFVHNLDIYLTGLLEDVFKEYVSYMYESSPKECIYYGDDRPYFAYDALRTFLPVWEILKVLGYGIGAHELDSDEDE